MKLTRQQVEQRLNRGEHVTANGVTVQPGRHRAERKAALDSLFGAARVIDVTVTRTGDGKLTRPGMEEAIRRGGSVLVNGEVVSAVEHLPDEGELAAGDAERLQAHLDELERQRSALDLQHQRARQALEKARSGGEAGPPATPPQSAANAAPAAPGPVPDMPAGGPGGEGFPAEGVLGDDDAHGGPHEGEAPPAAPDMPAAGDENGPPVGPPPEPQQREERGGRRKGR